jgi:DNA-binding transcriptional ArsR family regulator
MRAPRGSRPWGGRTYLAEAVKATVHPIRELILKLLRERERSTTELEQITGENRYNLYHHLAVLQQAGLVGFRYTESRSKEFHLKKPKRPDTAFLQLDRADPQDIAKLGRLLGVLRELFGDEVPQLDKVVRARILLSYPWSEES